MKSFSKKRPVLKINPKKADYFLEAMALLGLLSAWIIPTVTYHLLPDTIPTHFGITGKADGWGGKINIFILPAISLVLYTGISILNKFPHIFNYPLQVTEENALQLYSKGTRIIRIIKLSVLLLFLLIEWQICNSVQNSDLPVWFLPSVLILPVVLPVFMAFTLTRTLQSRKNK